MRGAKLQGAGRLEKKRLARHKRLERIALNRLRDKHDRCAIDVFLHEHPDLLDDSIWYAEMMGRLRMTRDRARGSSISWEEWNRRHGRRRPSPMVGSKP